MADAPNGGIVQVNTAELRTSAGNFDAWGEDLLSALDGLPGFKILAGNFPEATKLEFTVDERIKQLTTNVTNLGNALKDIGSKLLIIADDYDAAEDDNVDDANRLDPLYDAVNQTLEKEPPPDPPAPA